MQLTINSDLKDAIYELDWPHGFYMELKSKITLAVCHDHNKEYNVNFILNGHSADY